MVVYRIRLIESGGKLEFGLFVSFYVPLTSIDHPFRSPSLTFFVMLNWFTNIITGEHVIVSHYHIVVFIGEKKTNTENNSSNTK